LGDKYNLGVKCLLILEKLSKLVGGALQFHQSTNPIPSLPYAYEVYTRGSDWYAGFIAPADPDLCLTTGLVDNHMITIPDKTLHEINLTGFELKVRYEATPWSIKNRPQVG